MGYSKWAQSLLQIISPTSSSNVRARWIVQGPTWKGTAEPGLEHHLQGHVGPRCTDHAPASEHIPISGNCKRSHCVCVINQAQVTVTEVLSEDLSDACLLRPLVNLPGMTSQLCPWSQKHFVPVQVGGIPPAAGHQQFCSGPVTAPTQKSTAGPPHPAAFTLVPASPLLLPASRFRNIFLGTHSLILGTNLGSL